LAERARCPHLVLGEPIAKKTNARRRRAVRAFGFVGATISVAARGSSYIDEGRLRA
jgi:hypothetical protein